MSLYGMAFMGMGVRSAAFLAGVVASKPWRVSGAFAAAGGVVIVAAALFAWQLPSLRPLVRPIYQKKGILPGPDGSWPG